MPSRNPKGNMKGIQKVVMNDVLTEGPSRESRTVGRAQGTYVMASLQEGHPALVPSMNVVLTDYDDYTASTLVDRW